MDLLVELLCSWLAKIAGGNGIAVASKGHQTFCTVLHPGEYCCISQYMFPDGATEATESNV
uniref:Uncharacterized protein n=1 Tax=Buteo japonicus TaxID=224669 RepID=A0A8B9YYT7_9AVES